LLKDAMKTLIALLTVTALSPAFAAADMSELAKQKNCLACHSVDKKLVGPAYKDVAAKYAGQKDAAAKLADKIQKGGVGAWGQVPMPANPVTPDEAKQLAAWVLSIK
jgi:cytochrome c